MVIGKTLDYSYIGSNRTFWSFFDFKAHAQSFAQGLRATWFDSGIINKYIGAVFLLDESKTFMAVKPFNNSLCSDRKIIFLFIYFNGAN